MDEDQNKIQSKQADDNSADIQKLADDYLNNWKRERADFINYKAGEARRVEETVKYANEGIAIEVIEVLDGLEIAMKQVPEEIKKKHPDWLEGITSAISKFQKVLNNYDIRRINTEGEKFNPGFHEALETHSADSTGSLQAGPFDRLRAGSGQVEPDGEKIEEVRAGYMLGDKVFRPARVKIVK